LARPSAREDGTLENQNARISLDLSHDVFLGKPEVNVRGTQGSQIETIEETTR
jgi:hypothetical protein